MAETNKTDIISDFTIDEKTQELYNTVGSALYQSVGSQQLATFQNALYGFDNIRNTVYMPEMEGHGFTFITRPKLNLTSPSLRCDRVLNLLDSLDPHSISFAIRAMLDTNLKRMYNLGTSTSPFFNSENPFISLLTNRLMSLNGWPDPTIDVETTEGGFFSESITYPKGHDQLTRNYDLSATFSDIQGSPVHAIFMMWVRWIGLANRGIVTPYTEDIESRRMCFTSSVYRFVMDPSNRYITKWAKATGCFPRNVPTGQYFNYDANASNVDTAMNLSIPITVAGKVEYMDPIILKEFNMLVDRFSPATKGNTPGRDKVRMLLNFKCIPYIELSGSNELMWMYDSGDSEVQQILQDNGYRE